MSEEIYPYLNEEEDIRIDEIWNEHWRDVAEESENNKKVQTLRWEIYVKYKEDSIRRDFLVYVPHPKGGNIIWNCVNNHIINEKEQYKDIRLRGFDYKLFE